MKTKIGIIGDGNVGSALRRGLERAGYDVRAVGKGQVTETGRWAEVIMLAVPYGAIDDVVAELGDGISGKTLVDVTNALTEDMQLASGCTTSGAEALQQKARAAKVSASNRRPGSRVMRVVVPSRSKARARTTSRFLALEPIS